MHLPLDEERFPRAGSKLGGRIGCANDTVSIVLSARADDEQHGRGA